MTEVHNLDIVTDTIGGCGLTASEAVRLASLWWDKTGRGLVHRKANESRAPDVVKGPGLNGAPAIRIKPTPERSVDSGVLDGRKWEDLTRREKLAVTKAWLAEFGHNYPAPVLVRQ